MLDYIVALLFIFFSLFLNIYFFYFLWKWKELVYLREPEFYVKYNSLVGEFKNDKGYISLCFYPIYLLRRTLFIFSLYNLYDFPRAQVLLNAFLSLLSTIYVGHIKPFRNTSLNNVNFYAELLLTVCFLLTFPYTFEDLSQIYHEILHFTLITLTLSFLLYSYIILVWNVSKFVINWCKDRKRRKTQIEVQTDDPENNRNSSDIYVTYLNTVPDQKLEDLAVKDLIENTEANHFIDHEGKTILKFI